VASPVKDESPPDLQLTQYGDGNWRATFYVTGAAHSIVGGWAWAPTPWRAVQRAVWAAVTVLRS
jgi:hypothetical protein